MAFECSDKVISSRVCEYNSEEICAVFLRHFAELGIDKSTFDGKKTVIKPNLVMKKSPEYAATIAPQVLDALLSALDSFGCKQWEIQADTALKSEAFDRDYASFQNAYPITVDDSILSLIGD